MGLLEENKLIPEWTVENLDKINQYYLQTGTCLLSPYPKTYRDNMEWRLNMLRRAQNDEAFRQRTCKLFYSDVLFAFNAFFYTLDVRRRPRHHRPFATYPYQDLVILTKIDHIQRGEDLAEEKSRDMGASWSTIGAYVWLWLHPDGGYDFLLGSRKEDYVDKRGDMRTLFEKARYILQRLPRWLMPEGWNPKVHDNFMKLVNPQTGSSITGESNNANFGTGGRYKSIFPDEFAKWKDTDIAAWTSMADATPCRMPASTPFGAFGQYFDVVSDGSTKKLTIHWSLHPLKNRGLYCVYPRPKDLPEGKEINWFAWKGEKPWLRSSWYDKETQRRRGNKSEIAQELDIDYLGSGAPVFTGPAASRMMELLRARRRPEKIYEFNSDYALCEVSYERDFDSEGRLIVYKNPTKFSQEVIGVDVVEGKEHGDYAVIKGLDRKTKSLAFTYYSRVDEAVLARVIETINQWLCKIKVDPNLEPWIAIETIGPGLGTFDVCVERGVTNLFMMPNYDSAREALTYQKGWKTGSASRKKLISCVKEWLVDGVGWVDSRCVREMTSFIYKNPNRPEAAAGKNDDEVIAWGICLAVDEILPGGEYTPPVQLRSDGLPITAFDRKSYEPSEVLNIMDKCLKTLDYLRTQQDVII